MSTTRAGLGVAVLATLVIGIASCGDDGEDRTTAPAAANATPRADADDLARYLMRSDEEPGFRPGAAPGAMPRERRTVTGVKALVNEWRLSAADERRLSGEGFISLTSRPIRGSGSAGVTEVSLYATAEGAERSLAHELRPDVIRAAAPVANVRFFGVPGIPGARGWTASLRGEPASRRHMMHHVAVEQPVPFPFRSPFHGHRAAGGQHVRHDAAAVSPRHRFIALSVARARHGEVEPVQVHGVCP